MIGTHKARAKEWGFGVASSGNEQVAVMFEITGGEFAGRTITWFGSFSDAAIDRTLDSLRHCGWDGDSLETIDDLGRTEVDIVVVEEEYQGQMNTKVRWVNRPARIALKHQLEGAALKAFASRLRGKAIAHKQSYGAQPAAAAKPANSAPRTRQQSDDYEDPGAPDDGIPY